MDSSNSGSFQSSSGGGAAADHEYDSTTPSQSQSQSQSISSAAANLFINNNINNPTTTTNFNHHHLLQPQATYSLYNQQQPPTPIQDPWTQTTFNPTKTSRGSDHQIGVVKNPKKRTRASRRAPTTVLTTDTTNFRQMVQEFTGIPAAPFTRRLDLFRPKVQSQPPSFLGNNIHVVAESSNNSNIIIQNDTTTTATAAGSYHLSPSPNLLDLQNPVFSFQSLLQNSDRWGGQNGKLESFEGVIAGAVATATDQVQVQDGLSFDCLRDFCSI